jgi:hypothetical protein
LLSQNFFNGSSAICRPPQNELLRAGSFVLLEHKRYALEPLRLIEDKPNRLVPQRCRTPTSLVSRDKR